MRHWLSRKAAGWLAHELAHGSRERCATYDLDDFPEESYQPRQGLGARCANCWAWDLIDNLREYAH